MSKNEFLNTLKQNLSSLSQEELRQTIDFYSEAIDDRVENGMSEDEAVNDLGATAEEIAQILTNNEQNIHSHSTSKHPKNKIKSKFLNLFSPMPCLAALITLPILALVAIIVIPILALVAIIVIPILLSVTLTVGTILLLITPIVLIAVVCGCLGCIFNKKRFTSSNASGNDEDRCALEEHREFEAVQFIEFNDDNTSLMLLPSPDENIHLKYWNSPAKKYSCSCDSDRLIIKSETHNGHKSRPFELLLPASKRSSLLVRVNNLSLSGDSIKLNRFNVKSINSKITLKELDLTEGLELSSRNSQIDLEKINSQNSIIVNGSNSKVNLDDVLSHEECKIEFQNSKINVSGIKVGKLLKIHTSVGTISGTIDEVCDEFEAPKNIVSSGCWNGIQKSVNIECKIGKINLLFKK